MESQVFMEKGIIDFSFVKQAVLILRTLNNPVCQKIFKQLELHKELTVTEIYCLLNLEQSVASMHLAKMRRHKVVTNIRKGKNIFYMLNTERLIKISSVIKDLNVSAVQTEA